MSANQAVTWNKASMVILLIAGPLVFQACSSPTAPPPPPGGGQTLVLSYNDFVQNVEPVLVAHGCDAGGDCHGGGIRGTLALSPQGAKDPQFDFDQVSLQVSATAPEVSPILTKPLAIAAGGTPHSVKVFADTTDGEYRMIRQWIRDGELH